MADVVLAGTVQCYLFGCQGARDHQKINCLRLWRSRFLEGAGRPPGNKFNGRAVALTSAN
jgi:hypothetical protein